MLTCKFETDVPRYLYPPHVQVDIHNSTDKRIDSAVSGPVHNSCDSRVPDFLDLLDQSEPSTPETDRFDESQVNLTSLY